MSISMYQASVPAMIKTLENLAAILTKTAAHADARKIDHGAFLGARAFPDMLPLVRQVQLSSDFAKNGTARIAGVVGPKFPDNEASFEELQERLKKTVDFLKTLKPEQFDNAETREITVPSGGQPKTFQGLTYLVHSVLPQFYFHVTTAYLLLREGGVEIGKKDFVGQI